MAILEKKTQNFIDELSASGAPPIYTLSPEEARNVLEKVQSSDIKKPEVNLETKEISGGPKCKVSITIIKPINAPASLPVIFYIHGAGWVMGSQHTHDNMVRKLATLSHAAVVFVNYIRSPEAKFPDPIEESYTALEYISKHGKELGLDPSRLVISGDSVGGNMTIAVTMLAKQRKGPKIHFQVLFYPVASARLDTSSYKEFANGPWLTKPAMEWFWNAYAPDKNGRSNPLASPIEAPINDLKDLPPALIMTAENDVLRDEGEEYAHHLMQAGVETIALRLLGTIHDFAMLNAVAETPAAKASLEIASLYIRKALKT